MEHSRKSWREILAAAMRSNGIPPEVLKTYMFEAPNPREIQPTRNHLMSNQQYSRKALMVDKDISIKMTIFNALDQGDVTRQELIKFVAINHGAQLSMDEEDFKNAQLHYSGVCRFVRTTLIRIQRESRS